MSTCPGTTLEDFVAWQYRIVITDGNVERNPNVSLRYAEAVGNATPLPRVSSQQLSLITQHYEPYREYIEDKLLDFEEEDHGSWRSYSEVVDSIVPADVQELADSEVKKINEINRLRAELEQSEARVRELEEAVKLAKQMFIANDLDLPHTFEVLDEALVNSKEGEAGNHLQWSEHRPPNSESFYDHSIAETPFGTFLLTWKSWKNGPGQDMGIGFDETPWGEIWYGYWDTPEQAQRDAEKEYTKRLIGAITSSEKEPDHDGS